MKGYIIGLIFAILVSSIVTAMLDLTDLGAFLVGAACGVVFVGVGVLMDDAI
jgi:hypothetical protein